MIYIIYVFIILSQKKIQVIVHVIYAQNHFYFQLHIFKKKFVYRIIWINVIALIQIIITKDMIYVKNVMTQLKHVNLIIRNQLVNQINVYVTQIIQIIIH